jgi:hypothetical protein
MKFKGNVFLHPVQRTVRTFGLLDHVQYPDYGTAAYDKQADGRKEGCSYRVTVGKKGYCPAEKKEETVS